MGIAFQDIYVADGLGFTLFDRINAGVVQATYGAGTTTGLATAVAVTWAEPIATPYNPIASPVEACTVHFTSKTTIGMTVNITPLLSTATLVGGTVPIVILG